MPNEDERDKTSVVQQNVELRRRLDEEHEGYKHKLRAYQDEQQRQTQLVQKLHAKVFNNVTSRRCFCTS